MLAVAVALDITAHHLNPILLEQVVMAEAVRVQEEMALLELTEPQTQAVAEAVALEIMEQVVLAVLALSLFQYQLLLILALTLTLL
jgi:succinate dehydrogenase/fumarate reductase flavoprotein subunit